MSDDEKKIIADDNWKEQARKEKEKLSEDQAEQSPGQEPASAGPGGAGPLPPANVMTLINTLVMQAMYYMGKLSDSANNNPEINLDLAKHHIDMLEVIEDKTKGNLTKEESNILSMALHEVRMLYVQTSS